jgi:hypothetical protein
MSAYTAFKMLYKNDQGQLVAFASVSVKVRTSDDNYAADLTTLTTDANGEIAAGTLAVPVGTRVRFRIENYQGLANSLTQITT